MVNAMRPHVTKKHFPLVTLANLAGQIKSGIVEPGQAVITVDDGYRDFYDIAFPVLREEGVPATFFVTTGFIDGQIWLWPDLLEYALSAAQVLSGSGRGGLYQRVKGL